MRRYREEVGAWWEEVRAEEQVNPTKRFRLDVHISEMASSCCDDWSTHHVRL